jgi:WhiB family redox-sensing transcriptional regulator
VTDWRDKAKCTKAPELFFPDKKWDPANEAKKICASCDVAVQCLQFALDNDEQDGVWGGMSESDRAKLRRLRERNAS